MIDLYIIGSGGVGSHLIWNLQEYHPDYRLVGVLDDDSSTWGVHPAGIEVAGPVESLLAAGPCVVAIGISHPAAKRAIVERLSRMSHVSFPAFISPHAWVSRNVTIGRGVIIYPGVCINHGCRIGAFSVINMNCAIGHDCLVGDYSSLAPGVNLGGYTRIESSVEMGIGSATRQNICVGEGAVIGGKTMVICNIPAAETWAGVPARLASRHFSEAGETQAKFHD
jgi:sugar O-acyltransferase (sialic acid O-acetyltransferase NeuD family)